MGNKHKHADLIKAWADEVEIQQKNNFCEWISVYPTWHEESEYRIKPEEKKPVVRWLWADSSGYFPMRMLTEDEAENADGKLTKLEWSRTEFPE